MEILLRLPVEISNLVIDLLDCKSLACLRLVCKEAQHIATPTFGRKHLHTLRPTFFPECLNALVEISENKLLRGHVKRILFATWTPKQSVGRLIFRAYDPEARERLRVAHKYCIEKQQPLIESGQHIKLIAQAFANFRDAEVPLVLGIFDNRYDNGRLSPFKKGWSADPFYDELFGFEPWTRDRGNVLNTVIKATNLCNYPLESVGLDTFESMEDPEETPVDKVLANIMPRASCGNPKLNFHFDSTPANVTCMGSRTIIDLQNCRFTFQSLQRFQGTNLAFFAPLLHLRKFAVLLRRGTNNFREIAVSRCEADAHLVSRFLRAQSGTLQRLRLSQIGFDARLWRNQVPRTMHAASFLRVLKDELKHLEYLELEDLKGSKSEWGMLPISTVKIKSGGRQDIESDLELWLQSLGITGEQHD